ncbi:MAG: GNAT family N-acetyltransferase [Planctomycetota bacterium]
MLLDRLLRRRQTPTAFVDLADIAATSEPAGQSDRVSLVEPSLAEADAFLAASNGPGCRTEPDCRVDPTRLLATLRQQPRGRERPNPESGCDVAYRFWIRFDDGDQTDFAGRISLRVDTRDAAGLHLQRYVGHIGYVVFPSFRGHGIARRATSLLLPLAKAHGLDPVWLTCNPDNVASRRTIEHLGGRLVETVDVPRNHPLYAVGDRQKCRYALDP